MKRISKEIEWHPSSNETENYTLMSTCPSLVQRSKKVIGKLINFVSSVIRWSKHFWLMFSSARAAKKNSRHKTHALGTIGIELCNLLSSCTPAAQLIFGFVEQEQDKLLAEQSANNQKLRHAWASLNPLSFSAEKIRQVNEYIDVHCDRMIFWRSLSPVPQCVRWLTEHILKTVIWMKVYSQHTKERK